MLKNVFGIALAAILVASSVATAADAPQARSALLFPNFYVGDGEGTLICVTNTNTDTSYCDESDYRAGDIMLHYIYIDGTDWSEFDRFEFLTPADTLCVLADAHNVDQNDGALLVLAVDPETNEPVTFEYLVGSAIMVDSDINVMYSYTPVGISGVPTSNDGCDLAETDGAGDGDSAADFDGVEYGMLPNQVIIPSFIEEKGMFSNELALFTTAGGYYDVEVNWLFYNNNERAYSRSQRIRCYWKDALSEISSVVTRLDGDPDELQVETGWASGTTGRVIDGAGNTVDGLAAPLVGVFAQFTTSNFAAGDTLYRGGTLVDGLEVFGGDLDHIP